MSYWNSLGEDGPCTGDRDRRVPCDDSSGCERTGCPALSSSPPQDAGVGVPVQMRRPWRSHLRGVLMLTTGDVDAHGQIGVLWEEMASSKYGIRHGAYHVHPSALRVIGPPLTELPEWMLRFGSIRDRWAAQIGMGTAEPVASGPVVAEPAVPEIAIGAVPVVRPPAGAVARSGRFHAVDPSPGRPRMVRQLLLERTSLLARVERLEELLSGSRAQVDYAQQRVAALEVEQRSLRAILGARDGEGLTAAAGRVTTGRDRHPAAADRTDRLTRDGRAISFAGDADDGSDIQGAGGAATRDMIGGLVEIRDLHSSLCGTVGVLREASSPAVVTICLSGAFGTVYRSGTFGKEWTVAVTAYSVRQVRIGDRVRGILRGGLLSVVGCLERFDLGSVNPFIVRRGSDLHVCFAISVVRDGQDE